MIQYNHYKCVELKLKHVWPIYHMDVDFHNYKNFDSNLIKTEYEKLQQTCDNCHEKYKKKE